MSAKRVAIIVAAILAVVGIAGAVFWFGPFRGDDDEPTTGIDQDDPATAVALAFAEHWEAGTLDQATFNGVEPATVATKTSEITSGLGSSPSVTVERVDTSAGAGDRAVAQATVTWTVGADQEWTYPTQFSLLEADDEWSVSWTPAVVHPSLTDGERFELTRTAVGRGNVLSLNGSVLVGSPSAVVVGIRKARTDDLAATTEKVAQLTGVDRAEIEAKLADAGPDAFVEITTMDGLRYEEVREELQPLPGTVFRTVQSEAAVPAGFARGVLGTVGPATEEIAAESDGMIEVGDTTGLGGVLRANNDVLGGTPGLSVMAVDEAGGRRSLKAFPGVDGEDLTVTLDPRIQTVAEAVLAETDEPSALVAIQISTGDVLAVANGPAGSAGYNRAFIGRYAPGSVFKIASTWALLEQGLTPDEIVDCPATLIEGKEFKNAGGMALGAVPFRTDFARSCNTAFVSLGDRVTAQQVADAAALLGYRPLELGAPMFQASVPVDGDVTEHVAQMIGQGRVEGNVLNVALMSASIASGSSIQPRLVVDPDEPDGAARAALDPGRVTIMRDLMRAVVTEGTADVLADVPGGDVFAKTGTAEFGTEDPPETHAWITGYQGDVAFAVVVEGGGGGGSVAGPLAADFLEGLAGP